MPRKNTMRLRWPGRHRTAGNRARAFFTNSKQPSGAIARLARSETGATLVETAISLSILLCVLVGTFEMCLALYSYHYVSYAAREASRYAVVRGSTSCSNTPNLTNCNITSAQLQTWVQSLGFPGIISNNLTVTTTWPTTGANCYPSTTPCNNPSNLVNVVVNYAYPFTVPFWKSGTINISSTSQMVISQ